MVFTTGQMLGIGAFTAAVLVLGLLLLKLDSMIGTNYDVAENDPGAGEAPIAVASDRVSATAAPAVPPARSGSRRRKHGR